MTWRRLVVLEIVLTVLFAVLFVTGLAQVVLGVQGGATLGNLVSIAVLGILVVISQWLMRQAQRHAAASDREPTDLKDLVVRLNTAPDMKTRCTTGAGMARVRHLSNDATAARGLGTLEVLRLHRRADSLASYQIWIDGQISTEVSDDATVDIELAAGIHTVQVRIAWCRSRRETVEIAPSVRTAILCHSLANRLNVLLLGTLGYRRYISLSAAQRIPE